MGGRFLAVMVVGAFVAGHAAPAAPATPAPAGSADGVYQGTALQTKVGGKHACTTPSDVHLTIRDGVVRRRWNGVELHATVQPDGSFQATGGRAHLAGRVGNGTLEYDMTGEYCAFHYTMSRVG